MKLQTRPNRGGAPDLPPESSPASTWDPKEPTEPDSPNDPTNSLETHGEVDDRAASRVGCDADPRPPEESGPPASDQPQPSAPTPPLPAIPGRDREGTVGRASASQLSVSGPNTDN